MLYPVIKHLHVTCVILSIAGFCFRGMLHMQKSTLLTRRWMRILPHANDTVLLAAALALTVLTGQYPFLDAWLTAKVFGLIGYIILAALAFQSQRPPRLRLCAGGAAIVLFGWIVSVALLKHPLGVLMFFP